MNLNFISVRRLRTTVIRSKWDCRLAPVSLELKFPLLFPSVIPFSPFYPPNFPFVLLFAFQISPTYTFSRECFLFFQRLFHEYRSRAGRRLWKLFLPIVSYEKRQEENGSCIRLRKTGVITSDENNNFFPIKCHQVWNVETVLDILAYVVARKVTSFSGLNSIGRQGPDLDSSTRTRSHTFTSTYFRSVSPFTGRQNARMRPRNEQTVQTSPTGRSNWLIKCHSRIWPASLSIFPEEKVFFQPARGETYLSVSLVRIGYRIGGEKFTNSSGWCLHPVEDEILARFEIR